MFVKQIKISNFKSFQDLDIKLDDFNVLIGANASGKTNFIQIFKFLRDIAEHGLESAISMQGDVEYFRNIRIGSNKNFSLEIIASPLTTKHKRPPIELYNKRGKHGIGILTEEVIYKFSIGFKKRTKWDFAIYKDELTLKCQFFGVKETQQEHGKIQKKFGAGQILLYKQGGKTKCDLTRLPKGVKLKENDVLPEPFKRHPSSENRLLLEDRLFIPAVHPHFLEIFLSDFSIYDFDARLAKKSVPITGKTDLEEDGSNLAVVLNKIKKNEENNRKLFNLTKDLLPFMASFDIEKFTDKSLFFKLQEKYFRKKSLPASMVSDGTLNIICLILALYFGRRRLTIIEEPERNIHPYLISKAVEMMKDASKHKQIIVTTHNPEVVKYTGLNNLLLVSRDKKGFSKISRPSENKHVNIFLQNELGIDEVYVKNLLDIPG